MRQTLALLAMAAAVACGWGPAVEAAPPPAAVIVIADAPADPQVLAVQRAASNPGGVTIGALGENVLPARPVLRPVPRLTVPASFCTQKDLNEFHDDIYQPANQIAFDNNELAARYIKDLEGLRLDYLSAGKGFATIVVAESVDYQHVAQEAFALSNSYNKLHDTIVDTPIKACAPR